MGKMNLTLVFLSINVGNSAKCAYFSKGPIRDSMRDWTVQKERRLITFFTPPQSLLLCSTVLSVSKSIDA